MPAARIRILWGDERAGSLQRLSIPLWLLEIGLGVMALVLLGGTPLAIYQSRAWRQAGSEARELSDQTQTLRDAMAQADRGRGVLRTLMADNARMLSKLTEHQATPVIVAERPRSRSREAPWTQLEALPVDALWMRAQRQEAVLTRLVDYWQHAARRLRHTPAVRPVAAAWLSSSFGIRQHPLSGALIMHKGLDLAGRVGMPVTAPADGVVIWVGTRGGYGQTVVVDHGWGLQTHFAHLSKYCVSTKQTVKRGSLLAEMGSTGHSTGPHLHYEVRLDGFPIDPRKFILD